MSWQLYLIAVYQPSINILKNTILPIKKTFTYAEKSEEKRAEYQRKVARVPKNKRVYVDESGVDTDLVREHGRSPKRQKVEGVKRGRKFERTNVIAGLCNNEVIAPHCYNNTTTGESFETWFKDSLLINIPKGYTIIMDNASFHRKKLLKKIVRGTGVRILYLSPYSPDYNPIETKWANMKRALVDLLPKSKSIANAIYKYLVS